MRNRRRRSRAEVLFVNSICTLFLFLVGSTQSQEEVWEMRVCADPNSLPFSHENVSGLENRIAEILADELGARVTYDWYPFGPEMITYRLREGECDMVMGVPDGHQALLTTVAYYQSSYSFVYRADAPFEIDSFDNPELPELRIGIQNAGIPPHEALLNRGLQDNVIRQYGQVQYAGGNKAAARLFEDLSSGKVDVGIWGPGVGYFAERQAAQLEIVPVAPQIEVTPSHVLPMTFPMTIGVRQGDEQLRDELNVALVQTWDRIQAVLAAYAVPGDSPSRPILPQRTADESLRIGLVVPTMTGVTAVKASLYDIVGEAARMGAVLAQNDIDAQTTGPGVKVLLASSPGAEAAQRAGERLLAYTKVSALVGGLGDGQADVLATLAEEHEALFFNIGSSSNALRRARRSYVFHVEASARMYLDAQIDWFTSQGRSRWFIVHENSLEGEALRREAQRAVAWRQAEGKVVGSSAVITEEPSYVTELTKIRQSGADAVLLLLNPLDQMVFMAQQESLGPRVAVAPFPYPVTQTRDYLAAARLRAAQTGTGPRVLLWETTLKKNQAGQLNERFISRWGEPMEPSAWAAYAALKLLHEAVAAQGSRDPEVLKRFLESSGAVFALYKGPGTSFRSKDHQLRQPLYIVTINPTAAWGTKVSKRVNIANLVKELPLSPTN